MSINPEVKFLIEKLGSKTLFDIKKLENFKHDFKAKVKEIFRRELVVFAYILNSRCLASNRKLDKYLRGPDFTIAVAFLNGFKVLNH